MKGKGTVPFGKEKAITETTIESILQAYGLEGAPLSEYFFRTGKALGKIHRLSAQYVPVHRHPDYFVRFSRASIDSLIPDSRAELKQAVFRRMDAFERLPRSAEDYGLVHIDPSGGNYHIDMENGDITVFDFNNCVYCCCRRDGEEPDPEDIEDAAGCLIRDVPRAGFFGG